MKDNYKVKITDNISDVVYETRPLWSLKSYSSSYNGHLVTYEEEQEFNKTMPKVIPVISGKRAEEVLPTLGYKLAGNLNENVYYIFYERNGKLYAIRMTYSAKTLANFAKAKRKFHDNDLW